MALEDIQAHEHRSKRQCPYCHERLLPGADAWECAKCATQLHAGCAAELKKCPTLGCATVIERASARAWTAQDILGHATAGVLLTVAGGAGTWCAGLLWYSIFWNQRSPFPRHEQLLIAAAMLGSCFGLPALLAGVALVLIAARGLLALVFARSQRASRE